MKGVMLKDKASTKSLLEETAEELEPLFKKMDADREIKLDSLYPSRKFVRWVSKSLSDLFSKKGQ